MNAGRLVADTSAEIAAATNEPIAGSWLRRVARDLSQELAAADQQQQQQQEPQSAEQSAADWWSDYWSRQPFPSGYTQSSITLLGLFISTIIFLIVVGNVLVCIAIFTEKSLKSTQNWFIASLAVSDMLLGALVMPGSLARELMGFWAFGAFWCDVHEAIDVLLTTASINTLCLISLDRYWSITQAVSYLKKRTPRRGAFMIAFVWLFSAAVSLPPLFGWKQDSGSIRANASQPEEKGERRRRRRKHDDLSNLFDAERAQSIPSTTQPLLSSARPPGEHLLLPAAVPVPPASAHQQDQQSTQEYPTCQLSDDVGYVLYSALGSFYIPCAVMVFTYIKIFLAARSRARRARDRAAIMKQSREQTNKRNPTPRPRQQLANAVSNDLNSASAAHPTGGQLNSPPLRASASGHERTDSPLTTESGSVMRGKIVIVERRKSLAAAPGAQQQPSSELERIRECDAASGEALVAIASATSGDALPLSLHASGAKPASASALAGHADQATQDSTSSIITVMGPATGELPVTRFNFQRPAEECASPDSSKAAALLKAISRAGESFSNGLADSYLGATAAEPGEAPDVVVERRGTNASRGDERGRVEQPAASSTNETCFMTIEEDSDMFDAQVGRTILMVAGNASGRKQVNNLNAAGKTQGIMMTMMPAHQTVTSATSNHVAKQQQRQPIAAATTTRSASSYCGSSLTINDDLDDCVDDELLTDDCNGYSGSCGFDQYCSGASAANCPHCCQDYDASQLETTGGSALGPTDSPGAHPRGHAQPQGRGARQSPGGRHQQSARKGDAASGSNIDLEAQSLTGDDNLSLTEYRSNEDSSSVIVHDVLDATDRHHGDRKKRLSMGAGRQQDFAPATERKKSLGIGFRLTRLDGSSAPLSAHSGGLLALASSQQRQAAASQAQPAQLSTTPEAPAATSGGRNLKALRQNFFLKLNQLTAKSAAKQQRKAQSSPTGKSSAPSSGTSYEPSVDYATTSNVHSTEYHPDPMTGEPTDEYEPQTSSDNQQAHTMSRTKSPEQPLEVHADDSAANRRADPRDPNDKTAAAITTSGALASAASKAPGDRALLLRAPSGEEKPQRHLLTSDTSLLPDDSSRGSSFSRQVQTQRFPGFGLAKKRAAGARANRSSTMTNVGSGQASVGKAYLASDNERHKRKLAKARERRATLILGIIMTAFICSWMPFFTFYVTRALCSACREYFVTQPRIEAFIFWMGYCNSAINPIIYTIFNRDFRRAFRKILFRCL